MDISKKNLLSVLSEASIVGLLLVIFMNFVNTYLLPYIPDFSGNKKAIEAVFITGLAFHLICEYTGLNLWYSREYCKL